jgi:hypothetical protein
VSKKKNKEDVKELIMEDEDFIHCPRLGNSASKLIEKNPDGVSEERIAKVLLMTEEEVEDFFESALEKLREAIGIE